ncbi:hypothetical protein Q9966_013071 [Columba livia]|nr:hypothetical protein Q9966_013071 [Columba livia]
MTTCLMVICIPNLQFQFPGFKPSLQLWCWLKWKQVR